MKLITPESAAYIHNNLDTALIDACYNNNTEVALALIATGQSNPDHIDKNMYTALIIACSFNNTDIALALISTGMSRPEHFNKLTALGYACYNNNTDIALALIATGQSHPERVSKENTTALMFSCKNNNTDIALALIATGQSHPEIIENTGMTALIYSCKNNNNIIALAIIATGKSNYTYINADGETALNYAIKNNMKDVIHLINLPNNLIDTTASSHNYIFNEIIPHIANYYGITFIIDGIYASLTKHQIKQILATQTMIYDIGIKYVFTQSFCPIQGGLILWADLKDVLHKFASKYYILTKSDNLIGNKFLYDMSVLHPKCEYNLPEPVKEESSEITAIEPTYLIKYKNNNYNVNLPAMSTYYDIIEYLKPIIPDIDVTAQLIRFMYNGKVFKTEDFFTTATPGIYQMIITQRGTKGGKKHTKKLMKNKIDFKL